MGTGQVAAARAWLGRPLLFETFPFATSLDTTPAGSEITDSAAGATAMATGRRVAHGVISREIPGSGSNLVTAAEILAARGRRIGLLTTSYMVDATPAAWLAHTSSRYDYTSIAAQYLSASSLDVVLGGGTLPSAAEWGAVGFTVVTNSSSLATAVANGATRIASAFDVGVIPYEYDGLGHCPSLAAMTRAALAVLGQHPEGMFLMIEGGRIDHAAHANDLVRCIHEVVGLEAATREVLHWAATRDDVLVLVTADHETGGLEVLEERGAGQLPVVRWNSAGHTAARVALYAWGAGAARALGARHLTDVYRVMTDPSFPPPEIRALQVADGRHRLEWLAISGRVYHVEITLTPCSTPWLFLAAVTSAVNGLTGLELPQLLATNVIFYRLGQPE